MSNNYEIELIKRLKQQPRHGQNVRPITDVDQALRQLFELYKSGGEEIIRANIFGQLAAQINTAVKDLTLLQDINQGVGESFNVNSDRAAELGVSFDKLAIGLNRSAAKAKSYAAEVRGVIGTQTKLYTKQTDTI